MTLSRQDAITAVVGDHLRFAVIAGLGSAVFDMARLTNSAPHVFPLDGVMGAAIPMGLGLALARPDLHVLVVTGDGEALMNVGALATVAVQDPANLSVIIVDNGTYGLTGGQAAHTAYGTDLAGIAAAAGIRETATCREECDLAYGAKLVSSTSHASVVVLKVNSDPSPPCPVERDGAILRSMFATQVQQGRKS